MRSNKLYLIFIILLFSSTAFGLNEYQISDYIDTCIAYYVYNITEFDYTDINCYVGSYDYDLFGKGNSGLQSIAYFNTPSRVPISNVSILLTEAKNFSRFTAWSYTEKSGRTFAKIDLYGYDGNYNLLTSIDNSVNINNCGNNSIDIIKYEETYTSQSYDQYFINITSKTCQAGGTVWALQVNEMNLSGSDGEVPPVIDVIPVNVTSTLCLDSILSTGDYNFQINLSDANNDTLYYAYNCNYQESYWENVIDLYKEPYNLWADGWNNGSCEYDVEFIDAVFGNGIVFNSSTCISDIEHQLVATTNQSLGVEFSFGVSAQDYLRTTIENSDGNIIAGIQAYHNNTKNRIELSYYNGSDYIYFTDYIPVTLFVRLLFDVETNTYTIQTSNDFKDSFTSFTGYPILNTYNIGSINFNPVAQYTFYPQYIGNILVRYLSDSYTLTAYNGLETLTCSYDEIGTYKIKVYGYANNDTVTDTINAVVVGTETYCPQTLISQQTDLSAEYVNVNGFTGIPLILDQILFLLRFPYRLLLFLNLYTVAQAAMFLVMIVFIFYRYQVTGNFDYAIVQGFISSLILWMLKLFDINLMLLITMMFCIIESRKFVSEGQDQSAMERWMAFFSMFGLIVIILDLTSLYSVSFFELTAPAGYGARQILTFIVNIIIKVFTIAFVGVNFDTSNVIGLYIGIIVNAFLWIIRLILSINIMKYVKEMIPVIG